MFAWQIEKTKDRVPCIICVCFNTLYFKHILSSNEFKSCRQALQKQNNNALVIHKVESNAQLMLELAKNNNMSTGEWYKTKAAFICAWVGVQEPSQCFRGSSAESLTERMRRYLKLGNSLSHFSHRNMPFCWSTTFLLQSWFGQAW